MKNCKRIVIVDLLIVICSTQIAAEEQRDTSSHKMIPTDAIQIHPYALLFNNAACSYEHLFGKCHGVAIKGNYQRNTEKSFHRAIGIHYRFHYHNRPKHAALNSPFWGAFTKYAYNRKNNWKYENSKRTNQYTSYDVVYHRIITGVYWGRRWVWDSGISYLFRIGGGMPHSKHFNWEPFPPEEKELYELQLRMLSAFDVEFSVGYAF